MPYPHIALMGRARSGKDTIAKHLITRYAYVRVAFADPLKAMALEINPIVHVDLSHPHYPLRLSDVVKRIGWEQAKDLYPEVRRTLQRVGQSVRANDASYWLDIAFDKIAIAEKWNLPVVVTDCRYPNEAVQLSEYNFRMVRVERLGLPADATGHESETALDNFPSSVRLTNDGSLADLASAVDALL